MRLHTWAVASRYSGMLHGMWEGGFGCSRAFAGRALAVFFICAMVIPGKTIAANKEEVRARMRYTRTAAVVEGNTKGEQTLHTHLYYVKVPKCASSTAGGVTRNIAALHGISGHSGRSSINQHPQIKQGPKRMQQCWANRNSTDVRYKVAANHAPYLSVQRSIPWCRPSFLWTMVREPAQTILSSYYFFGAERGFLDPASTSTDVKAQLVNIGVGQPDFGAKIYNYICSPLKVWPRFARIRSIPFDTLVENAVAEYDFVGVAERFDESMVVLAHLLNIDVSEVLHVNSKVVKEPPPPLPKRKMKTHQRSRRRAHKNFKQNHKYAQKHKPFEEEPAEVQAAFANKTQWIDSVLWRKANADLDKHMAVDGMKELLAQYNKLQKIVAEVCTADNFPDIARGLGQKQRMVNDNTRLWKRKHTALQWTAV
eukprot:gene19957-29389_t